MKIGDEPRYRLSEEADVRADHNSEQWRSKTYHDKLTLLSVQMQIVVFFSHSDLKTHTQ